MAKSMFLSTGRYFDQPEAAEEYPKQLGEMQSTLRRGENIDIPQAEIDRIIAAKQAMGEVGWWGGIRYLLVVLVLPILGVCVGMVVLTLVVKWILRALGII